MNIYLFIYLLDYLKIKAVDLINILLEIVDFYAFRMGDKFLKKSTISSLKSTNLQSTFGLLSLQSRTKIWDKSTIYRVTPPPSPQSSIDWVKIRSKDSK